MVRAGGPTGQAAALLLLPRRRRSPCSRWQRLATCLAENCWSRAAAARLEVQSSGGERLSVGMQRTENRSARAQGPQDIPTQLAVRTMVKEEEVALEP